MDIVNLNLAKMVGKVMDKIMKYQIFLPKCNHKTLPTFTPTHTSLTKPLLHYKSQNLLEPLLDINVKTSMFSVSQL